MTEAKTLKLFCLHQLAEWRYKLACFTAVNYGAYPSVAP
jgi:hypothetical protein